MLVSGLFFVPAKSEAAGDNYILHQSGQATENQEIVYDYTINKECNISNVIYSSIQAGINIAIYKAGKCVDSWYVSADNQYWFRNGEGYCYDFPIHYYSSGEYQIKLSFDRVIEYYEIAMLRVYIPKISNTSATITKGFTKKLSVKDAGGKVTWSSSNKSVATVDKNGKVTAKKKGTATISAKTTDTTLKCKVTVKDNVYSVSKPVVSEVPYGKWGMLVYKMSYDKKGDLVLKCRVVNNIGYKIVEIRNFGFTAKSPTGKTMGKVSVKKMKLSVPTGSTKDITLKIKKSNLKIKKADLRNSTCENKSGKAYYKTF